MIRFNLAVELNLQSIRTLWLWSRIRQQAKKKETTGTVNIWHGLLSSLTTSFATLWIFFRFFKWILKCSSLSSLWQQVLQRFAIVFNFSPLCLFRWILKCSSLLADNKFCNIQNELRGLENETEAISVSVESISQQFRTLQTRQGIVLERS